jgi:hypothetical protein
MAVRKFLNDIYWQEKTYNECKLHDAILYGPTLNKEENVLIALIQLSPYSLIKDALWPAALSPC